MTYVKLGTTISVLNFPKREQAMAGRAMAFTAGTYLDQIAGAIYVKLGSTIVYFMNDDIVGVSVGDVMYCNVPNIRNTSNHKRIKQAMHNRPGIKRVIGARQNELNEKAGDAVMLLANKLIERRLKGEDW